MGEPENTNSNIPNSYQSPNWLVDDLMCWLEPNEWVGLSFMVRHILGWRDKIDKRRNRISLSQFEDGFGDVFGGCGLSRPQITRALNALVRFRVIVKVGEATKDGQEWWLPEAPNIDWEGLRARREAKTARGKKRIQKAAATSAEKRKVDTADAPHDQYATRTGGTSSVPVGQYATRTGSTPSVPADRYATRTPAGTPDVPLTGTRSVHTKPNKKPNVVGGKEESDIPDHQQQGAPVRAPVPAERALFEQHHVGEAIWRSWMRHDPVTVVAAILHATLSNGVQNPVGLMRAMLEQGTVAPGAGFLVAAREQLGTSMLDMDALEAAGWDPRLVGTNGNGHEGVI